VPLHDVLGVHGSLALAIHGSDRDVQELAATLEATEIRALHARLQSRHGAAFARGMLPALTSRKRQILRALAAGQTTTEMADSLGISVFTVDKHMADLKHQLRARTAAQLAALAVQYALLDGA
jgi:DNA-binding CsgD family transcriptional regulator